MADKRVDIVELKSDNYQRWRNDLQVALIIAKCEIAIVDVRPAQVPEADWDRMVLNAKAIILKGLRDEFWRVSPTDTPFQILHKIEAAFQPTSALIAVLKVCKFFSLSEGVADGDIVKEITSHFAEMRRAIQASDALRGNVVIDDNLRTAVLAFAIEKSESAASLQMKERFERNAITFEQAVALLAEVRLTHRKIVTGTPMVNANTSSKRCDNCNGLHPLEKCWFADPSLAPERLQAKICKICKKVGHPTKDCVGKGKANSVREGNAKEMCFGLRDQVYSASLSADVAPTILDSGCTTHMMTSRALFSAYNEGPPSTSNTVYTASGQPLPVIGHGSVSFKIENLRNGENHVFTVSNVLHVPSLKENILSVAALDKKGIATTVGNQKMMLRHNGNFVCMAALSPETSQYHLVHKTI